MSKTFLFASAIAMCMALASCSDSSDVVQEKERKTVLQYESVDELARQLKEYNSQFLIKNGGENDISRGVKVTYSKSDIVKIAISDVKGGIRGAGGGPGGAIVGAATSSLIKFSKITLKKLLWGYIKENYLTPHVYKSNDVCQYADSIGYYHNELEYAMYDSDRELQEAIGRICIPGKRPPAVHVARLQYGGRPVIVLAAGSGFGYRRDT